MGCALPLANGAALGVKRPVLCIVGDGCLEMSLGELATLRDMNLPVVIAVLVNGSLNLIAMKQNQQGLARASSCNRARNRLHRSAGALAVGRTAESGDPSG